MLAIWKFFKLFSWAYTAYKGWRKAQRLHKVVERAARKDNRTPLGFLLKAVR